MGAVDHQPARDGSHSAWEPLDDALQILVRAQSIMMLLECASDVEEHHRYCAQIACDELRSLKMKVTEALGRIRPARRARPSSGAPGRSRTRSKAKSSNAAGVALPGK